MPDFSGAFFMMRNNFIILFLAIALFSCTKMPDGGRLIKVKVTTEDTKGTVITTAGLVSSGAFAMDAYIAEKYIDNSTRPATEYDPGKYIDSGGSANVVQNAGEWTINGNPNWVAYTPTRFWAWHPVTLASGTRSILGPTTDGSTVDFGAEEFAFTYATPTVNGTSDATNATDLIFACYKKTYDEDRTDETIVLKFHHALSQVRFCVSTEDGTFDPSLEITSVTITGLKTSGRAMFSADGFEWSDQDGEADFGQVYGASFKTLPALGWTAGSYPSGGKTYDLHTCQNVFFMIPQTVSESNCMTVAFKYGEKNIIKTVPITNVELEWLADHYYTYKIKATIVGRDIDAAVTLMSWSDRDDTIFI